jgi:cation transport ATPase
MDADAGAHGVLLDDPLASLVAARRVARAVHRRLRLQQGSAVAANAALMTAAALRWLPPIGTSLLHHGFALLLLLDSLHVESLDAPPRRSRRAGKRALARPRAVAEPDIIRSETV